jgi:hypothetical protein
MYLENAHKIFNTGLVLPARSPRNPAKKVRPLYLVKQRRWGWVQAKRGTEGEAAR